MVDRDNITREQLWVDRKTRASLKNQKPCVIWFTGLSGAGKSTIANALETLLVEEGRHTFLLDGDNLRLGLNRDLGFSREDRSENIRRSAEVAKLMADAGLIVIVACISPFEAERAMAKQVVSDHEFIEVFVDTPIEVCISRDPKGLYKKALSGDIKDFTGLGSPYEVPKRPDVVLTTAVSESYELALRVQEAISKRQPVDPAP